MARIGRGRDSEASKDRGRGRKRVAFVMRGEEGGRAIEDTLLPGIVHILETKSDPPGDGLPGGVWVPVGKSQICGEILHVWRKNAKKRQIRDKTSPVEASWEVPSIQAKEKEFFHSSWWDRREAILAAVSTGAFSFGRLERFRACGSDAWVYANRETGELRTMANYCHDRHCQRCATAVAWEVRNNLASLISGRVCWMVTLTKRHDFDALSDLYDQLFEAFDKLREQKYWKENVKGGAYTIESKYNEDGAGWHPHFHLIVESNWLEKEKIRDCWFKATGDSFKVDVRPVTSDEKGVGYLTKYISKPFHQSIFASKDLIQEAVRAMSGRRLIGTFGSWRSFRLRGSPVEFKADDWKRVGKLETICDAASAGEIWAVAILASLRRLALDEAMVDKSEEIPF